MKQKHSGNSLNTPVLSAQSINHLNLNHKSWDKIKTCWSFVLSFLVFFASATLKSTSFVSCILSSSVFFSSCSARNPKAYELINFFDFWWRQQTYAHASPALSSKTGVLSHSLHLYFGLFSSDREQDLSPGLQEALNPSPAWPKKTTFNLRRVKLCPLSNFFPLPWWWPWALTKAKQLSMAAPGYARGEQAVCMCGGPLVHVR